MMDLCLGKSALRRTYWWPEFATSLPTVSTSRVCELCPRAFAFESQVSAPAKGFPLFSFDCHEGSILQKPNFVYDHHRGGWDFSSQTNLSVWQFFSTKAGDSRCSSRPRETFTLTRLATGSLDLHGWKVLLRDTKEVVGTVDEVIHIGSANSEEIFESVLKLIYISGSQNEDLEHSQSDAEDSQELDYLEILIPLVEDIVREVDVENSCLFITVRLLPIFVTHLSLRMELRCMHMVSNIFDSCASCIALLVS